MHFVLLNVGRHRRMPMEPIYLAITNIQENANTAMDYKGYELIIIYYYDNLRYHKNDNVTT